MCEIFINIKTKLQRHEHHYIKLNNSCLQKYLTPKSKSVDSWSCRLFKVSTALIITFIDVILAKSLLRYAQ